jgi:hypothetical protein
MKEYVCQINSVSGRILEIFFEDYLDAVRTCTESIAKDQATQAVVFHYPNMTNIICSARIIK